jgi:hemerythrin
MWRLGTGPIMNDEECIEMKKSINWSEDLLVNVHSIDHQHKELYGSMNALLEAVHEKQPYETIGSLLQAVRDHTTSHCEDEEALMLRFDYPALEPQRKDHDYFSREILSMEDDLSRGMLPSEKLVEDLVNLADFFSVHIRKLDGPLGRFINDRMADPV